MFAIMLTAVVELSIHAREKFPDIPGGTILGLMLCGLMLTLALRTVKTSAGKKKEA